MGNKLKTYQTVENPIVFAMNKASLEQFKASKDALRDKNEKFKLKKYEKYIRYKKKGFDISKCDGGFIVLCIDHLQMYYTDFSENPISQDAKI